MRRRRILIAVVALLIIMFVGFMVMSIAKLRADQDRYYSLNNLRELSLFAQMAGNSDSIAIFNTAQKKHLKQLQENPDLLPKAIPAGSIVNPKLAIDERLSWVVSAIPYFNQTRQDSAKLIQGIDLNQGWAHEANRPLGDSVISTLIPTTITVVMSPGQLSPTFYVGIGGISSESIADAATLKPDHPQAGCFRYDAMTPFQSIGNGRRESILFAETAAKRSPWIKAGPGTIMTIGTKPFEQVTGVHQNVVCLGYADGSAGFVTPRMSPEVFRALCTINGNDSLISEQE